MRTRSLRFRMIVLFCTVVSLLLGASYLAFMGLLIHEIPAQLYRQLEETARPLLADIAAEPAARDVERLDIPGQFFELLDSNGNLLQKSQNLTAPLTLPPIDPNLKNPTHHLIDIGKGQMLRVVIVPFQQAGQTRFLAIANPMLGTNQVMDSFAKIILFLFPISVLITAGIATFYVGRALTPIADLTQHAASMAKRVTHPQGFWEPLPVRTPHDGRAQWGDIFNIFFKAFPGGAPHLPFFVPNPPHVCQPPFPFLQGG